MTCLETRVADLIDFDPADPAANTDPWAAIETWVRRRHPLLRAGSTRARLAMIVASELSSMNEAVVPQHVHVIINDLQTMWLERELPNS